LLVYFINEMVKSKINGFYCINLNNLKQLSYYEALNTYILESYLILGGIIMDSQFTRMRNRAQSLTPKQQKQEDKKNRFLLRSLSL